MNLRILLILTICLTGQSASASAGDSDPEAMTLIQAYNGRDLSAYGERTVDLELRDGEQITRKFIITNLWSETSPSEVVTLYILRAPEGLSGTLYLLNEYRGSEANGMRVSLHLPVGQRKILNLAPQQFDEGLLGSDFTYRDVRWLLPETGFSYRMAGTQTLDGTPVQKVEMVPDAGSDPALGWTRAMLYLSREHLFLFAADYFAAGASGNEQLVKQMRVESTSVVNGHWTATEMTMRLPHGRASVLKLRDIHFADAIPDPEVFREENLLRLADDIRLARPTGAMKEVP